MMKDQKTATASTDTQTEKTPEYGEFYVSVIGAKDGRRTVESNLASKKAAIDKAKEKGGKDAYTHAYQFSDGKYNKIYP